MDVSIPSEEVARRLAMLSRETREFAVLLMDVDGVIGWGNPGAEYVLGYSQAELAGLPMEQIFTPEDEERGLARHEREVAAVEGHGEDDRWTVRADGSRFWATGVLTALHDDDGRLVGFGKVLRNRTDLREQIDTLRNLLAAAEDAGHRREVFLSTLSHELRNPLAPLFNAVRILRMGAKADDAPEHEQALRVIERQMAQLQRLVDDLLDMSRIATGKVFLEMRPLVLQEVLVDVAEDIRPRARQRGLSVEVVLPVGPLHVNGDLERLRQVFANLANNAVKFTPEGGRITFKATAEGREAVARIQDTGIGIAPELLPRLFDLFTQADSAYVRAQGGLGIGLALVKDLVTRHGGNVQVVSEGTGKGSDFSVRLPLIDP